MLPNLDAAYCCGPMFRDEYIVDVIAEVLVAILEVCGPRFLSLTLGVEGVIGAGDSPLFQKLDDNGVIGQLALTIPNLIAVEISSEDHTVAAKAVRMVEYGFVNLSDIALNDAPVHLHRPNSEE